MTSIDDRVKLVADQEMKWDWDSSNPLYLTNTPNSKYGGIHLKFDPFPCYHHDINLVKSELERIQNVFPIKFDIFCFIFQYECISRTNGQAYLNTIDYKTETQKETWDGVIDLYGKRIPLHPAMTRYLINHEASHLIDSWICHQEGLDSNGLDKDYAKLRNIEIDTKYGGRKWHSNIGEIIANDIRIVLFNAESEFWPHDCEHPLKNQKVIDFWNEMKQKHSYLKE